MDGFSELVWIVAKPVVLGVALLFRWYYRTKPILSVQAEINAEEQRIQKEFPDVGTQS